MPSRAIFIHIPKTAGRTVESIIHRNYRPANIYELYGLWGAIPAAERRLREMPDAEKHAIRLVKGHSAFGLHTCFSEPVRYFTFLREPADRVVSLYFYLLQQKRHPILTMIREHDWSLEEFVRCGVVSDVDNEHVRYLSGIGQSVPVGGVCEEHLEQAKRNIVEHDMLLGLTSRFDESLVRIARHLEWRSVGYTVQNAGNRRPPLREIAPGARAAIEETNRYDLALYEFARARLEQQVAEEREQIDADLRRLEKAKAVAQLKAGLFAHLMRARAVAGKVKRFVLRRKPKATQHDS